MRPMGSFFIRVAVSAETVGGQEAIFRSRSLGLGIPFLRKTETG